ncbi:MAG: PQQ-binding-like beta-propeller repeat protein [Planctomycetes bacterium]|nr:PQQ-binding-like beta-propeller repeat protein [Planctomycetota bacterium]
MSLENLLFIGTKKHVRAVRKADGVEVWTTEFPVGFLTSGSGLVTLLCEGGKVYAGVCGHLYALDAARGEILWHSDLKGLGYHHLILATASQSGQGAAPHIQALQAQAVAALAAINAANASATAGSGS